MKIILFSALAGLSVVLAPVAAAGPALCSGHSDHGDQWGMPPGNKYVAACAGDSGPDAFGNNATAPRVSTDAS